jgi:hypothetical protein
MLKASPNEQQLVAILCVHISTTVPINILFVPAQALVCPHCTGKNQLLNILQKK